MAKTRMLKHDLRTSEKVASWPIEIRYFWALLWGYVDDHGKGKDSPLLIKADTFPLDPGITGDVVDEWLWLLAGSGVLARYTVDGTNYLAVVNWKEHQKPPHPTADVLPAVTDPRASIRTLHAPFTHDAGSTHESVCNLPAPFIPVLGCIGSVSVSGFVNESSPAVKVINIFDEAWASWPKKVERKAAEAKFRAAPIPAVELADHIKRFGAAYAATTEKQFTPALGVWISHERWSDELPTAPASSLPKVTAAQKNLDVVDYFKDLDAQKLKHLNKALTS